MIKTKRKKIKIYHIRNYKADIFTTAGEIKEL